MIFLAAGLPDLEFQAGLPVPGAEEAPSAATAAESGSSTARANFPWMLQGALALGFILLLFALLISIRKKAGVKRIGWVVAGLGILLAVLYWLLPDVPMQPVTSAGNTPVEQAPTFAYNIAPIGDPPAGLFWFVIAVLLLAAAILVVWLAGYQVLLVSPNPVQFASQFSHQPLAVRAARLERIALLWRIRELGVQVMDWSVNEPFLNMTGSVRWSRM